MSDTGKITVTKVGDTAPVLPSKPSPAPVGGKKIRSKTRANHNRVPKFGVLKGGKTARKTPRFEAVADPAKAPPSRKSSKTLRILTEKGAALRRKKIADSTSKTPISKIRTTLRKHGLPIKDSTPEKLARKIYEDAQEAGMVSSD
jgi:hypothetical protein